MDRERKDLKDRPVGTVSRDPWVCQAPEDPPDPLERTETRESLENQARREVKVTRENTVPPGQPGLKDRSELLVPLVPTVSLVPEASRVCLDRRETKDPEASPDPRVPSGCRVCPVPPARKAKPETSVKWVHPALLGPEAPPDPREPTAPRDPRVALETQVPLGRREMLVKQESQAFRENLARRVHEENAERRESLVPPALPAPLDPRAHPETTVPKAVPVRAVSPAILAPPESLAWPV